MNSNARKSPKDAMIVLRLPAKTSRVLVDAARSDGLNTSEAVRQAIVLWLHARKGRDGGG